MQAAPPGPVLNHQLLRCVKTLQQSLQALCRGIYPKNSCSLQRSCRSSITSFPRVSNSLADKAQARGRHSWEHGMHIWQGLGEEPTNFLPLAEAHSGHDEVSCFWHPHWQALEHKGTRVLRLGLQHLQHSAPLPEPKFDTVHLQL